MECRVDQCHLVVDVKSVYCRAHTDMLDRIKHRKSSICLGEGEGWTPSLRRKFFELWLKEWQVETPPEGGHKEWVNNHKDEFADYVRQNADAFLSNELDW